MSLVLKRMLDFCGALVLLVLASPLLLIVSCLVRIKLGAPVLFTQTRIGRDTQPFKLYKFRSMRNAQDASGVPLDDALRLTSFGKALRASSLDELPELWNILKGDMSFVGPRPLLPEYLPYYSVDERRRHLMRPGLTGLAQVKGRNALSWDERLAWDVFYVDHWSLGLDLSIAWSTLGVVLSRKNVSAKGEATMPRFDTYVREHRQGYTFSDRELL